MTPTLRLLSFVAAAVTLLPLVVSAEPASAELFQSLGVVPRELALGDVMPDAVLRGSHGEILRLADFRGKTVAVTFFYSRCTEAAFCPLVGRNFDVAQALLKQMDASGNCHLVSISLDPAHDSADVLAAYARGYAADPKVWTFATGDDADIQKLGAAVGLEYKQTDGRIDHNLRTVVLDANGRIRRIFRGDGWTPQELAAELNTIARRFR